MSERDLRATPLVMPDQRASTATKQMKAWYIPNCNYWINLAIGQNDKTVTQKFLDAANGLVDPKTYEYVLRNYIDKVGEKAVMYGEIRDVDFLTPIKERYMGEFINMFSNYQVFNNDPSVTLARNKVLADKVMAYCNQEIINRLNEAGFNTGQKTIKQGELNDIIEEVLNDWIDDVTITTQKRLELINTIVEAKDKYQQCYFYWWACEEVYTYREVYKGDVYLQVISPLEYYRIESGQRYIEDDDAGLRVYRMTIPQIIDRFRDELTDAEMNYLKDIYTVSPKYDTPDGIVQIFNKIDFAERKAILHTNAEALRSEARLYGKEIDIYHYVWKTEIKQGVLKHRDLLGNVVESVVDENYEFDASAGDIEIEWEWINQVWEGWRIGGCHSGIYIKPRPIEVQRERFNNYSDCKLPYNGIVGLHKDNLRNPIPFRVLPYLALYRLYTLVEERTISKFRSWLLIPESFLADTKDMTMEERLDAANRDGTLVFDDSEIAKQQASLQAIKEIANTTMINYLTTINQIKQSIKQEAYELANMNDQRAGDIQARAGKAVTEMGLNQALMGSVWSLKIFDCFRSRDMMANLDAAKIAWIDGYEGSYVDPNTNEIVQVRVNGTDFVNSNLGIFVGNSAELNEQVRKLEEIAFGAAQNGNYDVAAEAVCNHNVASLRKYIKEAAEAQRQFELQKEEIQKKWDAEIEQTRAANAEAQRKFEAEQAQLDRDSKEAIAADTNLTNIIITDAKLQVDKNGNDYISEDESNSGTLDDYLKMTKLNLDIDRANLERAKFEEQKRMNRINANKPRKS